MNYQESKEMLIEAWGALGTSWGINRTMAQINIVLLISPEPMTTDEIMKELNISRGNANTNIRALLDWGLIYKKLLPGNRKEYFYSEKDIWEMASIVSKERKKRELEPALKVLKTINEQGLMGNDQEKELTQITKDLKDFTEQAISLLDKLSSMQKTILGKFILSMK